MKKQEDKLTEIVGVKLTESEKLQLEKESYAAHRGISSYIRAALLAKWGLQ